MKFSDFSIYLQKLEEEPKRLEITQILKSLLINLGSEEIDKAVYLSCGYLQPPFNALKFSMADKMAVKSLALAYDKKITEVQKVYDQLGDLGLCAKMLADESLNPRETTHSPSIKEVHQKLTEIATLEGTGSQDKKVTQTADLLRALDPLSSKFVLRIMMGTTRLGFTELTIIDALSDIVSAGKEMSKEIEQKYNIHPDIGFIAKNILQKGKKGLAEIKMETGIPVLSQKPQRLSDPQEILMKLEGTAWVEYKLDGMRVQFHLDKTKNSTTLDSSQDDLFGASSQKCLVKTFTRNLEENTYQFPDLVESALQNIDAESAILDGEAIGYDAEKNTFLPFQEMIQRKRKHNVAEMAKMVPLKYIVFDILYLNGQDISAKPLSERSKLLNKIITPNSVITAAEHLTTTQAPELWAYFEKSKEKNLEGVVVKNPASPYRAGAREFSWIKLKKSNTDLLEDTLECVVMGYYLGKGARVGFGIGGFLCGLWNEDTQTYKTITKVGTGLKDDEWVNLKNLCDKAKLAKQPDNYEVEKTLAPDVWVKPTIVVELGGDEITVSTTHSAGYALRFPRLIKFRDDKSPKDTTTIEEVLTIRNLSK